LLVPYPSLQKFLRNSSKNFRVILLTDRRTNTQMQKHNLLGGAGNKDVIHIRNCVLLRRHDDRNKLPSAALSPPAAAADEVDDVRGEM